MSKQQWQEGAIISIPLDEKRQCIGVLLEKPYVAFMESIHPIDIIPTHEEIKKDRIMFIVGIYKDIIQKGIWKKIAKAPNLLSMITIPDFYIFDQVSRKYSIYSRNGTIKPATKELCDGLEVAAIWDAHHIIERIMGYIEKRKDIWTKSI